MRSFAQGSSVQGGDLAPRSVSPLQGFGALRCFGEFLSAAELGTPRGFALRVFGAQQQLSGRTVETQVPPCLPSDKDTGDLGEDVVATVQVLRSGLGVA